jgi:hypothetical protein
MLSFGLVVASNNLLALKAFNTFLSNYCLFEKPSFIEKFIIKRTKVWLEKEAIKQFKDIREEVVKDTINLSLNDCPTGMFTVLHLGNLPIPMPTGKELFDLISHTELEFEKLKKPKTDNKYHVDNGQ